MKKNKPGTIFCIDLQDGFQVYARELQHPFLAIYDSRTNKDMELLHIVSLPPLFIVGVFDRVFKHWKKVGYVPLRPEELPIPDRFIQDVVDPMDCRLVDANGRERPATLDECEGRESASIWDSDQVEDRIRDHYMNRPNPWVELLKLKR